MKKPLVEYDDLYRNSIINMDKDVRIQYCYDIIDKSQGLLATQGDNLPKLKKFELSNLIEAAQKEVELLRNEKSESDISLKEDNTKIKKD